MLNFILINKYYEPVYSSGEEYLPAIYKTLVWLSLLQTFISSERGFKGVKYWCMKAIETLLNLKSMLCFEKPYQNSICPICMILLMCVHILVCVKHVHIHVCPPVSAGFAFMNLNHYKSKVFFLENSFTVNTQVLFLLFPT